MRLAALAGLLAGAWLAATDLPARQTGASADPLSFRLLDRSHGLPHNTTFALLQDHQGFLWVGTNDGMARYDGQSFLAFRHEPGEAASLANNTVRGLLEDPGGRIWVRTESGLDRFDRTTRQFHHYPLPVQVMTIGHDGRLIVAAQDGLYRYDVGADRFDRQAPFPLSGPGWEAATNDAIWGLIPTEDGHFWLSTRGGFLYRVDGNGGVIRESTNWRDLTLLREAPDRRLWVGHEHGVGIFDPVARRVVAHPPFADIRSRVIVAHESRTGVVWLGGAGLYRTDTAGRVVTPVGLGQDPLATPIRALLQDREGIVWLGTPRGLRFHDPYSKEWRHLSAASDQQAGLPGTMVMGLAQGGNARLWVATLDAGLFGVDGMRRGAPVGRVHGVPPSPCGERVWSVLTGGPGQTWMGSELGLCLVDGGRVQAIPLRSRAASGRGSLVFALARDQAGMIWAGGTGGLFRIDPQRRVAQQVPGVGEERDGDVNVEGLLVAADGTLWAGTSRSDLYHIDPARLAATLHALGDADALRGSEGFWALAEAGDGRLWLGSDRGLFLYDPADRSLRPLGQARGIPAGPVNALLPGSNGALWLSTNNGIVHLANPLADGRATVRHYTAADGLPFSEFNRRAAVVDRDGWLHFGGMGGVVRFHPAGFLDNPHPPPVVVTLVEWVRPDGSVIRGPPVGDTLKLEPRDAGLVVEFTAPTLSNAHQAQFRYRMVGVDPDWVAAGSERRVRYPALAPGRYTFEVRAANADGIWNDTGATLAIVVPPPWWATWWFVAAAVLLLAVLLATATRWIVTRPLRRQLRALELDRRVRLERERISRDLHDHVGAQVSTLLAGIELSELNASRGQMGPVIQHLGALRQDAHRTMTQLRETVWSLQQEHISARALVGQVQEHLQERQRFLAVPRLRGIGAGNLSLTLPSERALHLFRMAQESVSNAIRHAGATEVVVELTATPAAFLLRVTDNGTFRPPTPDHHGSGLAGMRARAAELGGTFALEVGAEGTTVQVSVPVMGPDTAAPAGP